jgi:alpha-mannosidase
MLDAAWEKLSYPHDHNVGGRHGEVNDVVRLRKAEEAHVTATDAIEEAVISITTHIAYKRPETPLVVFNPLSWNRTDVVETYLEFWPKPVQSMSLRDAAGREVPVQILSVEKHGSFTRITFLFLAEKIPPLGYATFYAIPFEKADPKKPTMSLSASSFENEFFRGELVNGRPKSLRSKGLGFELVGSGAHLFNEVVALEDVAEDVDEKFTGQQWRSSEHATHVEVIENGPVRGRIRVYGRLMNSTLEQDIALYAALPRLDLSTRIDWEGRRNTQVRIAMPFNVPNGKITYESPYAHVTMPDDEMPNTYRGSGGRFTGKWIDVSNGQVGVTLASRLGCHSLNGTTVYPVILRNAYSCGTPFLWYPQYGWHTFDFSLAAHAGDWRSPACYQLGWEFNNPLRVGRMCTARPIRPIAGRATLPESGSFCSVDQDGVVVSTIKKSYDGSGYVIRLVELAGKARGALRATLGAKIETAFETDLLERKMRELRPSERSLPVPVTAYGIHSFAVMLAKR